MAEIWPGRFSGARVVVTGGASGIGASRDASFITGETLVIDGGQLTY
jgi:hypothetical protein